MPVATIRDVARLAGVSVATVSRALNGHDGVTGETRQRVLDAAAELQFTPSVAARSLITRRTQTIGALLPELHGEFLSELIRGIEVAARARSLHLLVACASADADESETTSALRALAGRVDGLIVMPPHGDACAVEPHLPQSAVLLDARAGAARRSSIDIDHRGGAQAMVRHLAAQGHRSIAFIGGPGADFAAAERLRGYRDALAQALPDSDEWLFAGDWSERSGFAAGRAIASTPAGERPAAVFAANDLMAVGCLAALAEAGLEVPRDIALAGFDDIPMARYLRPPLSTVRVPIAEIGALALEQLAADIASADSFSPTGRTVPAQIVVRRSCAARPSS